MVWNSFWLLFMVFFAIPFPMIIYYATRGDIEAADLLEKNNTVAFVALGLSMFLWILLFVGYFRNWILSVFVTSSNIEKIKREGVSRQAEILSVVKQSKSGSKLDGYLLHLSFKNLEDTLISEKIKVNDAKPYERRYEVGKRVEILIDKEVKIKPYFIISSTEIRINIPILIIRVLGLMTFGILVMSYFIYAYREESLGLGWRFLNLAHPLIICPIVLFIYRIGGRIVKRYLDRVNDKVFIKFKGIKTSAKLVNVKQTGRYINDQPEINFELEYNENGQKRYSKLKKVIGLLELDLTKQERADIFYVPEDPKRIIFALDLEG